MQYKTVSFHQQQTNSTLAVWSFTEWIYFYLRSINFEKQSIESFNLLRCIILLCAFKLEERCHLARLSVSNASRNVNGFLKQQRISSTFDCGVSITQGVYKSSLTNFQEISRTHLTNFQYIFYIDRASLVLPLYVQWNGKLHYINAHTSMNSEMFSYEHVMMSSGQRSSLCHPSYFTNKNEQLHCWL